MRRRKKNGECLNLISYNHLHLDVILRMSLVQYLKGIEHQHFMPLLQKVYQRFLALVEGIQAQNALIVDILDSIQYAIYLGGFWIFFFVNMVFKGNPHPQGKILPPKLSWKTSQIFFLRLLNSRIQPLHNSCTPARSRTHCSPFLASSLCTLIPWLSW